ncbi:tetratricopeptide repeat protein [Hyphomicrobium sp. CS1BSMeth3]|uniref:tetratricopeptide repeat protein n=1 Tax=Hyphomicrobium sp. CS1BSMeth3 TaxID=1892844 RepID=UPI0009F815E7|nr:tetratricopeptide repeat protein [Hyphomicrobium sp. CS1BSMeth3]
MVAAIALAATWLLPSVTVGQGGSAQHSPPHNPAHAERAVGWCAHHLARGELVAALSDCDYAVALEPQNLAALSNRGSVYLLAGEPARALTDFNAAIALAPADPDLHFNKGIAHGKLGMNEQAVADYTQAIQLRPNFAIAYHNRGYEHEVMSRPDDALADYRHALALRPGLKQSLDAIERLQKQRKGQ